MKTCFSDDDNTTPNEIRALSPGVSDYEPKSQSSELDEETDSDNLNDEEMDLEEEAPDTGIRRNAGKTAKKRGLVQRDQINKMAAEINGPGPEPETKKHKAGPAPDNAL
jgi:hypothetical protein